MEYSDCNRLDFMINMVKIMNIQMQIMIVTQFKPETYKIDSKTKEHNRRLIADLDKYVLDYMKKNVRDMRETRITLPLLFYRAICKRLYEEDFMRFESTHYGIKYIFAHMTKECVMHIYIYRKVGGTRMSLLALRKLEATFMHELSLKVNYGTTLAFLEAEARAFLEEIATIMMGYKCSICNKFMAFNNDCKVFLPPTVKYCTYYKTRKYKYFHEGCL